MNRSANSADSALGVTIKLSKTDDGAYVAQAIGKIGEIIGPIRGRTESEAANLHTQAVQAASASGKI